MLDQAQAMGVSRAWLCQQCAIDTSQLYRADARVEQLWVTRLWQCLQQAVPNEPVSLYCGQAVSLAPLPLLHDALFASDSLGAALTRLQRAQHLVAQSVRVELQPCPLGMTIDFEATQPLSQHTLEVALVGWLHISRALLGRMPRLLAVQLGAQPTGLIHWRCWLPDLVLTERYRFTIAWSDWQQPRRGGHDHAWPLVQQQLQQLRHHQWVGYVRHCLHQMLALGCADRRSVASALHISVSTLQRRLRQHGLSFQQLLQQHRQTWACRWLLQGVPLSDIAQRLGYQDQTAFQRAFRHWLGCTPRQWQQGQLNSLAG
ncbi:AraC family transcriptional regulator [Bacterioplanes sanyensis]|nr:AraC family transcriptional regulator [Bacterioplanes sanyensis]